MGYSSPALGAVQSSIPSSKPTLDDIAMGRTGPNYFARLGGWLIRWVDALPDGSGLPPVLVAWNGDREFNHEQNAQLQSAGWTPHVASCEGSPPLGWTREGREPIEATLDARTAFLVGTRCPASFLPRQGDAFRRRQMPLATPQGVLDALWSMIQTPAAWPGLEILGAPTYVPEPTYTPEQIACNRACDVMRHEQAVVDYARRRITPAELVEIARECVACGGELDPRIWNEGRIPGWRGPGQPIGQTGVPVEVECPEGWTQPTPGMCVSPEPDEPEPCGPDEIRWDGECVPRVTQCPPGFRSIGPGQCQEIDDDTDPGYVPPDERDEPPPPPAPGDPGPDPAGSSSLLLWGAAGLAVALILGKR